MFLDNGFNGDLPVAPVGMPVGNLGFSDRSWRVHSCDDTVFDAVALSESIQLSLVTRNDPTPPNTVANDLYSSLKYTLSVSFSFSSVIVPGSSKRPPVLFARLSVVFPETPSDAILKRDGSPVIAMRRNLAFDVTPNRRYSLTEKLQLQAVSYHYERKSFAFRLEVFLRQSVEPETTSASLILLSAPFLSLSRRPKKKSNGEDSFGPKKKKRKKTSLVSDDGSGGLTGKKRQRTSDDALLMTITPTLPPASSLDPFSLPPRKRVRLCQSPALVSRLSSSSSSSLPPTFTLPRVRERDPEGICSPLSPAPIMPLPPPPPPPPPIPPQQHPQPPGWRNEMQRLIDGVVNLRDSLGEEDRVEMMYLVRNQLGLMSPEYPRFDASPEDVDWFAMPGFGLPEDYYPPFDYGGSPGGNVGTGGGSKMSKME